MARVTVYRCDFCGASQEGDVPKFLSEVEWRFEEHRGSPTEFRKADVCGDCRRVMTDAIDEAESECCASADVAEEVA